MTHSHSHEHFEKYPHLETIIAPVTIAAARNAAMEAADSFLVEGVAYAVRTVADHIVLYPHDSVMVSGKVREFAEQGLTTRASGCCVVTFSGESKLDVERAATIFRQATSGVEPQKADEEPSIHPDLIDDLNKHYTEHTLVRKRQQALALVREFSEKFQAVDDILNEDSHRFTHVPYEDHNPIHQIAATFPGRTFVYYSFPIPGKPETYEALAVGVVLFDRKEEEHLPQDVLWSHASMAALCSYIPNGLYTFVDTDNLMVTAMVMEENLATLISPEDEEDIIEPIRHITTLHNGGVSRTMSLIIHDDPPLEYNPLHAFGGHVASVHEHKDEQDSEE